MLKPPRSIAALLLFLGTVSILRADVPASAPASQPAISPQFFNAADHDQVEFVRKQIESGTDINSVDSIGRTALAHACDNHAAKTAQMLIEKGADVLKGYEQPSQQTVILPTPRIENVTPIYLAARTGNAEITKMLIAKKVDVKVEALKHGMLYITHETPLAAAARSGNLATVKLLVEAGADVQIDKKVLLTRFVQPIDQAIDSNAIDVAEYLVSKGGKITSEHLLDCVKEGRPELAVLCIKNGADLFQKNDDGENLLAIAAKEREMKIDDKDKEPFDKVIKVLKDAGLGEEKKK